MNTYIFGTSYVLGENCHSFKKIQGLNVLLNKYKLVDNPEYWSWGNYYTSEKSIFELAELSIRKTLSKVSLNPQDIDLVFFCCSTIGLDYRKTNTNLGSILATNNVINTEIIGQSFGGCVSIFYVMKIANFLLQEGKYKNIMIIASDKVPKGFDRMYQFGIFSDTASSFIMSSEKNKGYQLVNVDAGADSKLMTGIMEKKDSHFINLNKIHHKVINIDTFNKEDINKVFMTNLFKPILNINLVRLGYDRTKHFYKNIKEKGHCFASDPLVNLLTYECSNIEQKETYYLLAAMASGHGGFSVIKKI